MERTTENYISLYNTVGLIERDKNIYFVPHQADIYAKRTAQRTKVCDCYIELFNTVLSFSSRYHDIKISQWTPEDRSLVIEGTIDDFRQSRGRGLALNYLIVRRTVSDEESGDVTSNHYYFAYFIDSVEQRGNNSVRLSLTPDHFTNLYYLNNEDTLTSNYDPFNPIMKNCFVERQHYDRFEKVNNVIRYKNLRRILSTEETFKYKYQYKDSRFPLPLRNINLNDFNLLLTQLKGVSSFQSFISFINGLSTEYKYAIFDLFISYLNVILTENILLPIGIQSAGETISHYYKAGYSNYKGVSVPFTHIAMPFISIPNGFENIEKEWFKFCVDIEWNPFPAEDYPKSTIYNFTDEENYSPSRVLDYLANTGGSQYILTSYVSKYSTLSKNIAEYSLDNDSIVLHLLFNVGELNKTRIDDSTFTDREVVTKVNTPISISSNAIEFLPFKNIQESEVFKDKYVLDLKSGLYTRTSDTLVTGVFKINSHLEFELNDCVWRTTLQESKTITETDLFPRMVFVIGDNIFDEITISCHDGVINLDSYVDPIVSSDPYSFYSISLNEVEQIISKTRVIESYNSSFSFKLKPILSYNDSYKVGLIPSYYINSKWNRYYTESIVTVISSQVPIINDSWLTYYVQNKAQMKNQYAVQQNNYESGRDQAWVNMGASTMEGIIKGGSYGFGGMAVGGITGAVKGISGLINNAISNKYQVENITLNQKAKMADMGAKPDSIKLSGSDILYSLQESELGFYVNHYTVDEISYNSICKTLERLGYMVNLYDSLNIFDRVGLNYLKVTSFDFVEDNFVLSEEQMNAVSSIFAQGVTLLHDKDFLHNLGESGYHNIETALKEVI